MLKKTPFVLVCLLSAAIAQGSPAKARANPETRRDIGAAPHYFSLTGLTQIIGSNTIYSIWCALCTLHKESVSKSCLRSSSLEENPSPFREKQRGLALTQQPPKAIELAIGDRNFSQIILTNRDLPASFQAMLPADMEQLRQELNEDDFKVESLFAFADENNFELVMGITTTIESEQERAEFDKALNQPEELQALLTQGLGAARVLDKEPLQALGNIGDAVGGTRLKVNLDGIPAFLDIVAFRREVIGAFLFVMYLDGETPALSIAEIARKLDARAEGILSGSN